MEAQKLQRHGNKSAWKMAMDLGKLCQLGNVSSRQWMARTEVESDLKESAGDGSNGLFVV